MLSRQLGLKRIAEPVLLLKVHVAARFLIFFDKAIIIFSRFLLILLFSYVKIF